MFKPHLLALTLSDTVTIIATIPCSSLFFFPHFVFFSLFLYFISLTQHRAWPHGHLAVFLGGGWEVEVEVDVEVEARVEVEV